MPRLASLTLLLLLCCQQKKNTTGSIERIDNAVNSIIKEDATIEIIAEGFDWTEGPLWLEKEQVLLFSDVPKNIIYKWTNEKGKETYLTPSGYTGALARSGELGSNGLALNKSGQLVLCQHGNRQVAIMNAPIEKPTPTYITVADHYNSKRFNSPNDLVYDTKGNLYFTDPPYGLEHNMNDSSKELPFQGVYRVDTSGEISLLTDSITRPNGIALTPDETQLIVANSDSLKPKWYIYNLKADGSISNGRIFFDATEAIKREAGNPDGLKIDKSGNVFASGPGGIWIFNKEGKVLGKIKYPLKVSNCAFSADEKILYITADDHLLRVKMRD
jgi:gluconolactonase